MSSTPEHATGSFASLLGRYLAPESRSAPDTALDALADDIAVISYEQALKAHGRRTESAPLPPRLEPEAKPVAGEPASEPPQALRRIPLKAASVTVRLTDEELRLLHERAEAAGMTVSAYLRSCLFEVEKLRAEVRAAVEGLDASRAAQPALPPKKPPMRAQPDGAAWQAADDTTRPNWRSWRVSRWMGKQA